jgi:hypothetical protein
MAEVEWSALGTECLDRRIPDEETLSDEITAWEEERNNRETSVDWQFTTDDARLNSISSIPFQKTVDSALERMSATQTDAHVSAVRFEFKIRHARSIEGLV